MRLSAGLFVVLFSLTSPGYATPLDDAQALLSAGKVDDALHLLQSQPGDDASYHFNLGTLFYRAAKYGEAIAHLEKAHHLAPGDADTAHHLELAQAALGQKAGERSFDPASSWVETLSDHLSQLGFGGTVGLLSLTFVLLWLRFYLKTHSLRRTLSEPSGWITLTAAVLFVGLYGVILLGALNPAMMNLESQVVRSGPGEHFLELGRIEPGLKLRALGGQVLRAPDAWRQVRYSSDGVGWVRDSTLLPL
jgi:tetratricopeptide (TPR) repeat protein